MAPHENQDATTSGFSVASYDLEAATEAKFSVRHRVRRDPRLGDKSDIYAVGVQVGIEGFKSRFLCDGTCVD